jgi:hypothetical protein
MSETAGHDGNLDPGRSPTGASLIATTAAGTDPAWVDPGEIACLGLPDARGTV